MSLAGRVVARFRGAGTPPKPAVLAAELKKLSKTLIDIRPEVRDVSTHVSDLKQDYAGVSGFPGTSDPHVKDLKEALDELDHQIGQSFRAAAALAEKLEKVSPSR